MHVPIEQFLNTDAGAGKVMAHAQLLLRLSRRYDAIVPAGLSHVSRVANVKAGKIVIHADNGAVAAKLRQMSERLCQLFSVGGMEFNGMEIKVQPRETPYQSNVSSEKPIPARGADALRATAQHLPVDSPLRAAINKLLDRAVLGS